MVALADRDYAPVCASNGDGDKQLYARFQFKCVETEVLGDGGVSLTALVRPPFRVLRARSGSSTTGSSGGGGGSSGHRSSSSATKAPAMGEGRVVPAVVASKPKCVPSSVPAFFGFVPPASASAKDIVHWRQEVVMCWREIGACRSSGSELATVVALKVQQLEDLQRQLFYLPSPVSTQ